jgi:hypothetical protein
MFQQIILLISTHTFTHSPKGMSASHSASRGMSAGHSMGSHDDYIINCSQYRCGSDCIGDCGWSSENNRCVFGGTTTPSEMDYGPGCLDTDDTTVNMSFLQLSTGSTLTSSSSTLTSSSSTLTSSSSTLTSSSSTLTSSSSTLTSSTLNEDFEVLGRLEDDESEIGTISPPVEETNQASSSHLVIYIPIICIIVVLVVVLLVKKKKYQIDIQNIPDKNVKINTIYPFNQEPYIAAEYADAVNYEEEFGFNKNIIDTKYEQVGDIQYDLAGDGQNYEIPNSEPEYEIADNNLYEEPVTSTPLYNMAN